MRKSLSDHAVKALKPRPKRYAVADPEMRGHWIRIQPPGTKSYAAVARDPDGKQTWTTIGATDAMPIAKAREEARSILARVRVGLPAVEPKAETFAGVVANWLKRHVEARGVITAKNIRYLLDARVLPVWKDRPFVSIRRSDFTALLDQVEDRHGAPTADKVHKIVRSIMIWHASRTDDYNPPIARGMAREEIKPRARTLNDDEIAAFWTAAASLGTYGAMTAHRPLDRATGHQGCRHALGRHRRRGLGSSASPARERRGRRSRLTGDGARDPRSDLRPGRNRAAVAKVIGTAK